jgi:negative regulator of sigma-B (phosphoserine phosphatase)
VKLTTEYVSVPREGEQEIGDAAFFRDHGELSLVAVVDGLGHGARAAQAAQAATKYLADAPLERGLRSVIEGLHDKLRGTRGAAAMILLLGKGRLTGCGVGNVELRGQGARVPTVLTPGILGAQLPKLKLFEAPLTDRGRLVLFSDGVSARLAVEDVGSLPAREACRALMDRYRRPGDDATVLVTDFEAT